MIRAALPADKTRVIRLLQDSRAGAGFDDPNGPSGFVFPFDPAYAARLFLNYANRPRRVCFVFEADGAAQGVLMAHAFEYDFGPVWFAQERLWWIDPAHRGRAAIRMLDAVEQWAAESGCAYLGMAGMGEDPDVGVLYRRRGYVVAERNFLKPLTLKGASR
jgi:hypothetical protein